MREGAFWWGRFEGKKIVMNVVAPWVRESTLRRIGYYKRIAAWTLQSANVNRK